MIALFFSSFLAATFLPFSSEVHLVYLKTQGSPLWTLLIVATLGNSLGGMFTYLIGRLGKVEWAQKWLGITGQQIQKGREKINKFGALLAFFCWLPIVGDVFAFVLGLTRANVKLVALLMSLGKAIRYTVILYFTEELSRVFS